LGGAKKKKKRIASEGQKKGENSSIDGRGLRGQGSDEELKHNKRKTYNRLLVDFFIRVRGGRGKSFLHTFVEYGKETGVSRSSENDVGTLKNYLVLLPS